METTAQFRWAVFPCLVALALSPAAWSRILYVDDDANGLDDGSSWINAYRHLQDALADANVSEKSVEIRVAQGVYRPDQRAGVTSSDRNATFRLLSGVTLKGGYAGAGRPAPDARDIEVHRTTLTGDLKGDDAPPNAGSDSYLWQWYLWSPASGRRENSRHVVTASGTDGSAVLDGFIISAGNDDLSEPGVREAIPVGLGGGILNVGGSPTIVNCAFSGNSAGKGAAIYSDDVDLTLTNCTFRDNHAYRGGGLYNENGTATLVGCIFIGNSAYRGGGGLYGEASQVATSHCTFRRNDAIGGFGAAIANCGRSTTVISNCLFEANRANFGAGICNYDSSLTLTACTFNGNSGAGLGCYSVDYPSIVNATNCILWDGQQTGSIAISGPGSTIRISFCDVREETAGLHDAYEGVLWGDGNIIEVDPCFVSPGYWVDRRTARDNSRDDVWIDGDFHLKSQAGRWEPNSKSWVKDTATSPCIDAGDPNSPVGDEPFPNGGRINMGVYGGTAEASRSYFGEPVCETIIAGDINGDCKVDFTDWAILTAHWLEER